MGLHHFVRRTRVAASAESLFAWHETPGAFERLTPPWERVRVLHRTGGIEDGAQVVVAVGPWPLVLRWHLEHRDYDRGRSFTDVQLRGPFRSWRHVHRMLPETENSCILEDDITYELPFGALGDLAARLLVEPRLRRLFDYRHEVTRRAYAPRPPR